MTAEETEETYAISLVKTAETGKEIREVEDKKVLTETHTVRKGEYIYQIMRGKGLLENKPRAVEELLRILKRLNPDLQDLDVVHPGQQIVIPLKIVPAAERKTVMPAPPPKKVTPAELKDLDLKSYTVRRGDTLTRIVKGLFTVQDRDLPEAYLDKIRELNPSVKDPNIIYPGQVIRLPVYSPQIVRQAVEPPEAGAKPSELPAADVTTPNRIGEGLAYIFTGLGEEWIRTGHHFIPLKSGGQMDLKADAFPILSLRSGRRVVVDLFGGFPPRMPALIESNWGNYKVVQIGPTDDLRSALAKVMAACDYPELRQNGKGLEWGGDIPFRVSGDWIVRIPAAGQGTETRAAVIRLRGDSGPEIPPSLRRYLSHSGLSIVEYPPPPEGADSPPGKDEDAEILILPDSASLIRTVLEVTGNAFSADVDIPVLQSRQAAFKLMIKADFVLRIHEQDAVIDLHRVQPELLSLLRDNRFLVLSLTDGKDGRGTLAKVLSFLDIPFDGGPHAFGVPEGVETPAVSFTLNGIVFPGAHGKVLATRIVLPHEIAAYLLEKGYTILHLAF